jgi:hypothetical protein
VLCKRVNATAKCWCSVFKVAYPVKQVDLVVLRSVNRHRPSYCGEFFQMVVVLSQCSKDRDSATPILVRAVMLVPSLAVRC